MNISTAADGSTGGTFTATYDAASRLRTVTYPSSLTLTYTYTSLGYAQQITGLNGQVYWTANARDAELHLTQQTAGNGVSTPYWQKLRSVATSDALWRLAGQSSEVATRPRLDSDVPRADKPDF